MPLYGTLLSVYWYQKTGENATPRRKECPAVYEIEFVRGHVEVYLDGAFCFSADTWGEAEREIAELTA